MDDFVIYKIQKAENPSNDNEKPNALVLLNTITNESNELPALKSHQGPWAVKDGRDPETFVTANECPLQFKARDYFPRMPVACAKWDYFRGCTCSGLGAGRWGVSISYFAGLCWLCRFHSTCFRTSAAEQGQRSCVLWVVE